ncbi:MAG: NADH-quinone oxidoreductase subunit N [Myxococcales bacterium]|nr:NADH-quinone oxidoreductase subunit N [Myxococcales bacterium]
MGDAGALASFGFDPSLLAPVGFAAAGALFVLLGEVWLARGGRRPTAGPTLAFVAVVALALAALTAASSFASGVDALVAPARPMLRVDALASFACAAIAVASIVAIWFTRNYLAALDIDEGELYALLLLSVAGAFVTVQAVDLVALFMGIELMSLPAYALAGFDRRRLASNESGLKYFLVGSFASAVLLYGMALLYGATGATSFEGVRAGFAGTNALALGGLALVLAGFAFKIAAVPFHQWAPDVYEGAPTPVTAFMATAVKIAGVVALLRFAGTVIPGPGEVPGLGDDVRRVFAVLAVATLVVGNAMALLQTNLKRMLAYSSVGHVGFALVGLAVGGATADAAVLFYLVAYALASAGALGVVASLAHGGRERDRIDDLAGLAHARPGLAAVLALFLLSLAGIPGTAGFWAKLYVLAAAVGDGHLVLALAGVLTTAASLWFYLRPMVAMYMRDPVDGDPGEIDFMPTLALAVCAIATLWLGLFPTADPLFGVLDPSAIARAAAEAIGR